MSDLDRAIEFAGCERIVARLSGADLCLPHQRQNAGWPCRETVRVLALIREVRADELERAAKDYPNHVRGEDEFWSYNTTTDAVEEIGVEYMTQRAEEVRRA